MQGTILVATAGQGILRSNDDGRTWHRLGLKEAIEFDGTVRSLAVDPRRDDTILAGADCGLCISRDGGAHFTRLDSPMNGQTVWSLCIDPSDSNTIYAGTGAPSRCQLFQSTDGGAHWRASSHQFPEFCEGVNRPRLLTICVDPADSADVWFGVEEGGAWRSRDRGAHWERIDGRDRPVRISDIHAVSIQRDRSAAKTVLLLTVNAVYRSTDDGQHWSTLVSRDHFEGQYYTRTVQPLADTSPERILAVGDGTPGTRSMLYRSSDDGQTWQASALDQPPNSTFWCLATHAADPALLFAGTKYGHLYRSTDRGFHWRREWREFSEITAVAWTPHVAPLVAHAQSLNIPAPVKVSA